MTAAQERTEEKVDAWLRRVIESVLRAYFEIAQIDHEEVLKCEKLREMKLRLGEAGKALARLGEEESDAEDAPRLH